MAAFQHPANLQGGIASIPLQASRSKSTIAGNSNALHGFHVH
jgi:hypothetical protein